MAATGATEKRRASPKPSESMSLPEPLVLAGDVGGTNTRLALFHVRADGALEQVIEQTYPSHDYKSLEDIVTLFLQNHPSKPDFAAIGIAGPIRDGKCVATNLPWIVDSKILISRSGVEKLALLNDLEANAYGIATLAPTDFELIRAGDSASKGNAAVVSAGTGLGEAGMYWDGGDYHPFATEGGHSSFAPEGELQGELFQYLATRFGHVSCERVISGPGLQNVFEFLRDVKHVEVPDWLATELKSGDAAATISNAALAGKSDICSQALDLFVAAYGAEAGNFALNILATGGVYIGGGIAPKIRDKIRSSVFTDGFLNKGRMQKLLETVPIRIILNDQTALRGAARGAWLRFGQKT